MSDRPTIVLLHGLGLSARAFDGVRAALPEGWPTLAVDLPGHGDSPERTGPPVVETARGVRAAIGARVRGPYLLVGHSMGGKIASVVAALSGPEDGPAGVVLLAPSPPTPEPMDEDRRRLMLSWVADDRPLSDAAARAFLDGNLGAPLSPADDRAAVADLRRVAPAAWRAWLEDGSREDVSPLVGAIDLPAVVLAGTDDDDLGADAQPRLHGDVYPRARFERLEGAGHLLPYERPAAVAAAVVALWRDGPRHAG